MLFSCHTNISISELYSACNWSCVTRHCQFQLTFLRVLNLASLPKYRISCIDKINRLHVDLNVSFIISRYVMAIYHKITPNFIFCHLIQRFMPASCYVFIMGTKIENVIFSWLWGKYFCSHHYQKRIAIQLWQERLF